MLGGKQDKYKLRKKGRKGQKKNKDKLHKKGRTRQQKNTVKKTFAERQRKVNACMTKLILYSMLKEKNASAISKQLKRMKGNNKIHNSKRNKSSD